jgi:hypothetical protein
MRYGPDGRPEWKRIVSSALRWDGITEDIVLAFFSFKLEMLKQARLGSSNLYSWIHKVTKWDRNMTFTGK